MAEENKKHPLAKDGFIIPSHYMEKKYQTIDILEDLLTPDQYIGFNIGLCLKYMSRADYNKPLEDYTKASYYLNNVIMFMSRDNKVEEERVNPNHFKHQKIETIDMLDDQLDDDGLHGFYKGIIIKYLLRYKYKNGLEDLKKANYYLDRFINRLKSKEVK